MKLKSKLMASMALLLAGSSVWAATGPVITIDEYGRGDVNGTVLASHFGQDPNPAHVPGQNGVLIYGSLPFAGTAGDLKVFVGTTPGDVIRFNGDKTIIFYAAPGVGGNDNSPATQFQPNIPPFPVQNTATATFNGAILMYQPAPGQPGYDASGPTYMILFSASTNPTSILNVTGSNLKDVFQVGYSSNLDVADDVINISNAGSSAGSLPPAPGTRNPGNICVNAYVYQADAKLLACCACTLPADGLISWPVIYGPRALLQNSARKPSSVVLKLLATAPNTSSATATCDPTFQSAPFTLLPGMSASSTHTHLSNGSTPSMTETLLADRPLSTREAGKLQTDCTNLGSAGICPGCLAGGLTEPALRPEL